MKKVIRFVLDILLIACIVVAVFFGYKVYQRYREDRNNKETYQKIQTYAKKDIDWNKLRKINPDIVGWIKIKDTKINYPVVKGKTNRTYLHTDFNKKYNYGGCIFLDYHDHKDLNKNQHSIIYGHHMRNGSMFADLTKFREENFAKKHLIILYTPQKTYYLKAFSIYAKNADSKIPITFKDKNCLIETVFPISVRELMLEKIYLHLLHVLMRAMIIELTCIALKNNLMD